MLKLSSSNYYFYPVKGQARDDDGNNEPFSFTAKFKRIDAEKIEEIMKGQSRYASLIKAGLSTEEVCSEYFEKGIPVKTVDIARHVWTGWKSNGEVVDGDGEEIAYTEELRDEYLRRNGVPQAITQAWADSIDVATKEPKGAASKNSKGRPITG
jgi:hypothetical protein